jgi:PTS system galactitol-specific IIA component
MHTEILELTGDSHRDALTALGEYAVERDYAEEAYIDALLAREEEYPTGLDVPSTGVAVAIPHADPDRVNEQAVLLGLPASPIPFYSMDDPGETVDAELVVLLLVTDTEGYSTFLSNLTKLFGDEEFAERTRERDGDALLDLITERCL